jgi:hypothetical protein
MGTRKRWSAFDIEAMREERMEKQFFHDTNVAKVAWE